jgi:hypothetical protein
VIREFDFQAVAFTFQASSPMETLSFVLLPWWEEEVEEGE